MSEFLKKYTLPFVIKKNLQKEGPRGSVNSYKEAQDILLFFTSEGNQKFAFAKNLQNKIIKDNKNVLCLYLLLREDDKPDVHMDQGMVKIEKKDVSLFGEILKPDVVKLLNHKFDYLIHIDMEPTMYSDLIVSKSKAKCKVSRHFEDHDNMYDLMIKIKEGNKINYLLDQIYHYTSAL